MVRFGRFWIGFLHHTYRVWFHPMLDRTSLLKGKNRSIQSTVTLSSSVRFVQLYGYGKKNYVVEYKREEKNGWWKPENPRLRGKHY